MQYNCKGSLSNKLFFCAIGLLLMSSAAFAQLPSCTGASAGMIYYVNGRNIYNYDPTQPISASNPTLNTIAAPTGSYGLALGPNLNAATPNPTFYVVGANYNYYYYNGTTWVNTGYTSGNNVSLNPGSGGNYIYNLATIGSTQVYKYDGTGNASLVATIAGNVGTYVDDIVADCLGNFYVFNVGTTPSIYEYSSAGTLTNTWTVNAQTGTNDGAFAIVNNKVYYSDGTTLYGGPISGNSVSVSALGTLPVAPSDFASCPLPLTSQIRTDTVYVCSGGSGAAVTAKGTGPFTWTVISGPATVTGTGSTVNITAASSSVVVASSTATCGGTIDTIKVIVPTAIVSTGLPLTLGSCGSAVDTLKGSLTDTMGWITYNISWTPTKYIVSGANTIDPAVRPVSDTMYKLTVTTPANQGGCSFADSGLVTIQPSKAAFTVSADTICQGGIITFANASAGYSPSYTWSFGDGGTDTVANTSYTFNTAGTFVVTLAEHDLTCHDTATMKVTVDSLGTISMSDTAASFCIGQNITLKGNYTKSGFLNNSWDLGDGSTAINRNPEQHAYELAGSYTVSLTVNYRACPALTVTKGITINTYPTLNIGADTSMCPNSNTSIVIGDYVNKNASWSWNTGDTTALITATQPGVYYATVNVNGCFTTDSVWIKNDCYLSIPNVFTPNNDGVNDYFFPRQTLSSGVVAFKMDIYNRWGQLIYETLNSNGRGWDGKLNSLDQPEGVYIYIIDVMYTDGETENHKGNVTLLR